VDAPLRARSNGFRVADARLADEGNTANREQQQKELVSAIRQRGGMSHPRERRVPGNAPKS
jgi:hypothetical protein